MQTQALDRVLAQLRSAAAQAGGEAPRAAGNAQTNFADVLKASLDQVNGMQAQATELAQQFELGAPNASLQESMIAMQKANISFQQVVQVRNRLVAAYHEIMNMQV